MSNASGYHNDIYIYLLQSTRSYFHLLHIYGQVSLLTLLYICTLQSMSDVTLLHFHVIASKTWKITFFAITFTPTRDKAHTKLSQRKCFLDNIALYVHIICKEMALHDVCVAIYIYSILYSILFYIIYILVSPEKNLSNRFKNLVKLELISSDMLYNNQLPTKSTCNIKMKCIMGWQ